MARRSRADTASTRAAILDLAVDTASVAGLEGLTIGRLAEQAGMSKSGLIGHFGSKEQLQLAALEAATQRFVTEVWAPVAEEREGLPRLRALTRSWLSYIERDVFPGGCFLSAASLEFDDRPGAVRDAVAGAMRRWIDLLVSEIERARTTGELPSSTDAEQLAFELNATLMAANWARRLLEDPAALARAMRSIDRLLPA